MSRCRMRRRAMGCGAFYREIRRSVRHVSDGRRASTAGPRRRHEPTRSHAEATRSRARCPITQLRVEAGRRAAVAERLAENPRRRAGQHLDLVVGGRGRRIAGRVDSEAHVRRRSAGMRLAGPRQPDLAARHLAWVSESAPETATCRRPAARTRATRAVRTTDARTPTSIGGRGASRRGQLEAAPPLRDGPTHPAPSPPRPAPAGPAARSRRPRAAVIARLGVPHEAPPSRGATRGSSPSNVNDALGVDAEVGVRPVGHCRLTPACGRTTWRRRCPEKPPLGSSSATMRVTPTEALARIAGRRGTASGAAPGRACAAAPPRSPASGRPPLRPPTRGRSGTEKTAPSSREGARRCRRWRPTSMRGRTGSVSPGVHHLRGDQRCQREPREPDGDGSE